MTWKTLFLITNFPKSQVLRNYVFGYCETHVTMALDYASVFNHHESANVKAVKFVENAPGSDLEFQVRMGFACVGIAMF